MQWSRLGVVVIVTTPPFSIIHYIIEPSITKEDAKIVKTVHSRPSIIRTPLVTKPFG